MSSSRDQSPSASGVGVGGHTPGPWHYLRAAYVEGLTQAELIEAGGGQIVARVDYRDTEYGEPGRSMRDAGPANARLIAAAPDLLEALIEAVDGWEEGAHYKGEFLRNKHGDLEGIALARAAIAKALGPAAPDTAEQSARPRDELSTHQKRREE